MAKKDIKSAKVQFPSPIVGKEIIIKELNVSINYCYVERTYIEGNIQVEEDPKWQSEYLTAYGDEFEKNIAENEILSKALELSKKKTIEATTGLVDAIENAKSHAGG